MFIENGSLGSVRQKLNKQKRKFIISFDRSMWWPNLWVVISFSSSFFFLLTNVYLRSINIIAIFSLLFYFPKKEVVRYIEDRSNKANMSNFQVNWIVIIFNAFVNWTTNVRSFIPHLNLKYKWPNRRNYCFSYFESTHNNILAIAIAHRIFNEIFLLRRKHFVWLVERTLIYFMCHLNGHYRKLWQV